MTQYWIRRRELPLAVYREVAAHLSQISGVDVEVVPQRSPQFDYTLSQVDSLRVSHPDTLSESERQRLQQILAYYGDRYGAWDVLAPD